MAENLGKNASTHKGSLIGKRIKVDQVNVGKYFKSRFGGRQEEPDMRIITFEDLKGQVGTGAAIMFLLLE